MSTKGIRVTVLDLETGDSETAEIVPGNYVLVCAEPAYIAHTQAHANGTHILTVKGYVSGKAKAEGMTIGVPKPTPRAPKEPKRLKSRPHRIPDKVRVQVAVEQGWICRWCMQPGGALDLHHVQRRSQGGKDEAANLRPCHRRCHQQIHEHPKEAKRRGFLA